jgi:hypothetical protein
VDVLRWVTVSDCVWQPAKYCETKSTTSAGPGKGEVVGAKGSVLSAQCPMSSTRGSRLGARHEARTDASVKLKKDSRHLGQRGWELGEWTEIGECFHWRVWIYQGMLQANSVPHAKGTWTRVKAIDDHDIQTGRMDWPRVRTLIKVHGIKMGQVRRQTSE